MTPCYNEEENIEELCSRTKAVFEKLPNCNCEYIFIDNASTDRTVEIIKAICKKDPRFKLIVNSRNFGHIRSPYHALLQVQGDACVLMAADLQTPPEMIPQFIEEWERGFKIVAAIKESSEEFGVYCFLRKTYYWIVSRLADVDLIPGFTGFGLYDRVVLDAMRKMRDPYPYLRGIVCEIGFSRKTIPFRQPLRKRGLTKNSFYDLYDLAMLGLVNHSKVPLRMAIFVGFIMAVGSFLTALAYFIYKLVYWNEFTVGMAPVVIGLFLFSSIQLIFMGILGEYLGALYGQVKDRPLVIEKERVNF